MLDISIDSAIISLSEIIKIDSVKSDPLPRAPFGKGPRIALDFALGLLNSLGFRTHDGDGYYGYGEVGNADLPLFGILAHLDVVPVSPNWKHNPFGSEIENGYLYGRGTLDDKGPAIAAIYAVAQLLHEGYVPKKRIRIILGCDEESGWRCMERYCQVEEMPVEGFSPDADFPVINCEKGLVCHAVRVARPKGVSITAGTRSNIVPDTATATAPYDPIIEDKAKELGLEYIVNDGKLTVNTTGVSAHGSTPELGVNAISKVLTALGAKYELFESVSRALSPTDGSGVNLAVSDDKSGSLTLNLGIAETSDDAITFTVDIRHPISVTRDDVTAAISKAMPYAQVERLNYHDPLYVDKNDPLVKTLLDVYNEFTGEHAEPLTIGGGTYAKMLPKGVAYGPVFPGEVALIHGDDECISLSSYEKLIAIYKEAVKRLCF